jgi:hypothetical protein
MIPSISQTARRPILAACSVLLAAVAAGAQSMNIRLTTIGQPPSSTYGAAIGQVGVWNAVAHGTYPVSNPPTPLKDLAGEPTGASGTILDCDAEPCSFTGYGSDVAALYSAFVNGDCYAQPTKVILSGLVPGHYVLSAYGAPCSPGNKQIAVSLSGTTYFEQDTVSGAYNGSFAPVKLAVFSFELPPGSFVTVGPNAYAALSALQLTLVEPPQPYCTAKVNSQGCQALIDTGGGLAASLSGAPPFFVNASGVVTNVPGLFFFGHGQDIKPFMGGFHCVKPPTPRSAAQFSGSLGLPCSGTFAVDVSALLSSGLGAPVYAGAVLDGQFWYRDVNDPLGFGAATSDAIEFTVVP